MTNNKTKWEGLSLKDKSSLMKIFISQGIQDPTEMKNYYNQFQSKPPSQQNNSFADGGDTNPGMTGMMKARMALANEFGNKAAERMVSPNPNTYVFTGKENTPTNEKAGNIGTHYIGSYGNIVRPSIQEINGKMEYTGFPSERTNEDIKFETPEDAEYFAEHYKEIAPMMNSFADGGEEDLIGITKEGMMAMTKSLKKKPMEKKPVEKKPTEKASTGQILSEMFDESVVQPIKTVSNVAHAVLNPKETLYRVMSQSSTPARSISDVMEEIKRDPQESLNSEPEYTGTYVDSSNPNNKGRNLNKLYLYQDETGFRELNETEKNAGVNYSAYLKSVGRNPKDIKQYEGDIGGDLHFPEYAKKNIENLANLKTSKAIGMRFEGGNDNVAGHLVKLGRNAKGEVNVTRSDLWDFEPKSYSDSWGAGNLASYAQAAVLDKYGTPFILKDTDKVYFEKPEVAFDEDRDYGSQLAEYKLLLQSGIFPEMTVTPTENTFAHAAQIAMWELAEGKQKAATSKTNTNKKAFGGNLFANGGVTDMQEVYAMQRQMNPGLQQQMAQPSRNQGTLAAAPKGTFSKGFDNRTAAQRNADYLNPIKGAAERNAQAYQNGNSVWNGLQTVGETALNAAAATIGAGAVKGVTTAVSKVSPIAGKAIQGAGYLVDTNPLNYLTPTNNVQSTARKVSGVLSAPTSKGMATKALQTGTKLGTKALYNQAHFALGGPLFNEDNPIEAFGGMQTIPAVRFSAGGKIKKRRKSRC